MDGKTAQQVLEALKVAEERLQIVIAETARSGAYAVSKAASGIAEEVRRLRDELPPNDDSTTQIDQGAAQSETVCRHTGVRASTHRQVRTKKNYPRFEQKGDFLYRVGWSKKDKAEYAHKASKETYRCVVAAMARVASSTSEPISADTIAESIKPEEDHLSSYQVYVVIGFLKAQNVIEQKGRAGYRIPADVQKQANMLWQ